MLSRRRFKSWNIFDCGLTKVANGHHYWETKAFVDELLSRGETVRVFSHRVAPSADRFSGVPVTPLFSLFLYESVSDDPRWATLENFIVHNRTFWSELAKVDASLFHDSMVVFPSASESQLLGIFRWLNTFPSENGPKAAICLLAPLQWSRSDHITGLYRTVWTDCPPELRTRLAIFGRTPQIAENFVKHADMPARVFPHPIVQDLVAPRPPANATSAGPMVISFVGGARRERGGELIASVVRQCAGLGVQFFIQVRPGSDTDFDTQVLNELSALPHVRLHAGTLERPDYYRAIADSVVLLAYRPTSYRWRDSGVYHEAKCLDAPVLVSAGTFMADEVKSSGNGLIIEDFTADAIADCIARAQRDLPALKAAAARVGREARESYGVARCVDALAAPFMSPAV
jgi:hypothetical protein